jgi:membrane-associated phospholipid phosphatase
MRDTLQTLNKLDTVLTNNIRLKTTQSKWWRPAAWLAHSGDSWLWAIGVGLVWLFANPAWHLRAAILEISIVIQALFVFGLKGLIRRQRPIGEWGLIYRQYDPHSFPSGHATRAILLTVLGLTLGPAWFGWLLAIWAPLVCLSRVMTGVHYISDILGGMVLGLLMGLLMLGLSPACMSLLPFLFYSR